MAGLEGLLGLCARAGQITLGADLTLREVKAGRAGLVLVDEGASPGTKKKIADACAYRSVRLHTLPPGLLSRACGKEERMAGAVKPGPLCGKIEKLLSQSEKTDENICELNAKCGGASIE